MGESVDRAECEDFDASMVVETEYSDYATGDEVQPTEETFLPPTADGRIYCQICKGGPMLRKSLSGHMKHKHSGDNVECKPCNKTFACKAYLTNHQKTSRKERFRKLKEQHFSAFLK